MRALLSSMVILIALLGVVPVHAQAVNTVSGTFVLSQCSYVSSAILDVSLRAGQSVQGTLTISGNLPAGTFLSLTPDGNAMEVTNGTNQVSLMSIGNAQSSVVLGHDNTNNCVQQSFDYSFTYTIEGAPAGYSDGGSSSPVGYLSTVPIGGFAGVIAGLALVVWKRGFAKENKVLSISFLCSAFVIASIVTGLPALPSLDFLQLALLSVPEFVIRIREARRTRQVGFTLKMVLGSLALAFVMAIFLPLLAGIGGILFLVALYYFQFFAFVSGILSFYRSRPIHVLKAPKRGSSSGTGAVGTLEGEEKA